MLLILKKKTYLKNGSRSVPLGKGVSKVLVIELVVEPTHLNKICASQIGSSPQVGVKQKHIWNHHLDYYLWEVSVESTAYWLLLMHHSCEFVRNFPWIPWLHTTVDGGNPAPPGEKKLKKNNGMFKLPTLTAEFTGFLTHQQCLMQAPFHAPLFTPRDPVTCSKVALDPITSMHTSAWRKWPSTGFGWGGGGKLGLLIFWVFCNFHV